MTINQTMNQKIIKGLFNDIFKNNSQKPNFKDSS